MKRAMLLLFIAGALFSCKKRGDDISINGQLTGKEPSFLLKDTFEIHTRTIQEDSTRSDSLERYYIGSINDAYLGNYRATIFAEMQLDQVGQVLSAGNTLDSAVLTLVWNNKENHYGDSAAAINLKVYEVTEPMGDNVILYSNKSYAYNSTEIGSFDGVPNLKDTIEIRHLDATKRILPALRIPLSTDFANKLFNASATDLNSSQDFQNYIKGLAIVDETNHGLGEGRILAVDMAVLETQVTLYYDGTKQSDFTINNYGEVVNQFDPVQEATAVLEQKNNAGNYDTGYVNALTFSKVYVELPDLYSEMGTDNLNVNSAILKVRVLDESVNGKLESAPQLNLVQPDPDDGTNAAILDIFSLGGTYNEDERLYEFRVTRHIQDLLVQKRRYNQDNNKGLYITAFTHARRTSSNYLANLKPARAVLDTRPGVGISLEVRYSPIQ